MNQWTPVIALLMCACGSSEMSLPPIVSVEPQNLSTSESHLLTVGLAGPLPFKWNYGEGSVESLPLTHVRIADRALPVLREEDLGKRLIVEILPGLPVGSQELRVELQDGQQVVFEHGIEVRPALALTGFEIEPIDTQARGEPFPITLRTLGPDAALFRGRVKLSSSKGTVTPAVSNPFEAGVLTQDIFVEDAGGNNVAILIDDYAGHTGISNEFRLNSK